jgi:hypothetical protein
MISTTSLPLSLTLLVLSTAVIPWASALPDRFNYHAARASKLNLWPSLASRGAQASSNEVPDLAKRDANTGINFNPNGSAFLWLPSDEYSGSTFFECVSFVVPWNMEERWTDFFVDSRWSFFTDVDPTAFVPIAFRNC